MTTLHLTDHTTATPPEPVVMPHDQTRSLFARTMGYVALTVGLFAFGAYLGRDLAGGVGIFAFIAAFGSLIGMQFAVNRSPALSVGLLSAFGLLMGLATAPTLVAYASADPQALWQSSGATALFIAGFVAAGYATRRDLTVVARIGFWALVALVVFGIVLIFVQIPGGDLVYSVLGLLIFAALTVVDFQRLRRSTDTESAPRMAASIFLDALNVFLFLLRIFGRNED
jgi:FtsH-binding integral membrane protein